ncbi:hypothetical protein BDA96_02G266700 [Sorghum bicolor]|uniref:DNA topoisomerase n=1 Tax=Sorghum bicolor TaxID=4558 RepID=A0A921RQJ0_SORBI|nr:hypothetical protein BDA96_02G266700 [Sorghum bicolor]
MSTRKGSTDVHEFDGTFQGSYANFKVTSVIGHVLSVDFPPAYQNWEATDPLDLFEAPVLRSECNPKVMCSFTTLIETECNLVNCRGSTQIVREYNSVDCWCN